MANFAAPFVVLLATLAALAVRAYGAAIARERLLQAHIEAMFDVFRHLLLDEFHLRNPRDIKEERKIFIVLSDVLQGREKTEKLDNYRSDLGIGDDHGVAKQAKELALGAVEGAVRESLHEYLRGPTLVNFEGSMAMILAAYSDSATAIPTEFSGGILRARVRPGMRHSLTVRLTRSTDAGRPVVISEGISLPEVVFHLTLRSNNTAVGQWKTRKLVVRDSEESRDSVFELDLPIDFLAADIHCRLEQGGTTISTQLLRLEAAET